MNKINFFLVTYDLLDERSISNLESENLEYIKCYAVRQDVPKKITSKVNTINEWELQWFDSSFQERQFFEYGAIAHLYKNQKFLDGLTHVGLLHYDVFFPKNSIDILTKSLNENPRKIFYNTIRKSNDLYLTPYQFANLSVFMTERLGIHIDFNKIWHDKWISEALSIVPVDVFLKFGEFLVNHKQEIENILLNNQWGIMDHIKHRICGIVERMWGMYLVSLNLPLEKMIIEHDWNYYNHAHLTQQNWIK